MICLRCDNETFVAKTDAVIQQEFRNELLEIRTPALECSKCGWVTVDAERADELRRRTADAYRKKHSLLTSDEIKARRQLLGMNQRDFAAFLGAGEASVKRWETWLVQEKSSDELIRLKCAQPLRNQLAQDVKTPFWITFEFTLEATPSGIRTPKNMGAAETPALPPSRWKLPAYRDEPQDQKELVTEDLDENAAAPLARAA